MKTRIDIAIGIDCGTSGIRAVALSHDLRLLAQAQHALSEQTPDAWWQTTVAVMDALSVQLTQQLAQENACIRRCAIACDATSSTVFLMNRHGDPISDVRMYYHSQPEWAQQIKLTLPADSGAQGANSSLAKVLALSQTCAETDWLVCHQADWLLHQLTGRVGISDENNTLKLGYDANNRCWPDAVTQVIPKSALPHVLPPATPIAPLLPALANAWQLPIDTQVATGTTDSIAAFCATQANQQGDAVISLGSTLAFKLLTNKPHFDANRGIYSHRLWDRWLVGGASNAGGAVLLEHLSLAELEVLSQQIDWQQPLNLGFYPLPSQQVGERFPLSDTTMRSQITPRPTSDIHFLQALLEGLVAIEQQGWQALADISQQPIKRLFTCGGGTKNPAWAGFRSQQLAYPTAPPFSQEAAVGSALLALRSLGV